MKLKFRTEKECFHNGRHYEAGDIVECDCKECKAGRVSYFTKLDKEVKEVEEKNVSRETITEEKKEEPKVEEPKEEVKPKKRNKIEIV